MIRQTRTAQLYSPDDKVVAETTAEPRLGVHIINSGVTDEVTGQMTPKMVTDGPS